MMTPEQTKLVTDHVAQAQWLARKDAARTSEPYDDVLSDAYMGLVAAARNYRPVAGKRSSFFLYATTRIKGAIADGRRDRDRLSRTDRRASNDLDRARARFVARERRYPTTDELLAESGWTSAELAEFQDKMNRAALCSMHQTLNAYQSVAFEDLIRDDTLTAEEAIDVDEPELQAAVMRLPQNERFVALMYWYNGHTLTEVGEMLGVTDSRVSQLKTKALSRLRLEMAA